MEKAEPVKVEEKKESKVSSLIIAKETKKEPIKLMGAERWRNVEIILTKLKIPKGEMKRALIECSGKYSNPLILESAIKVFPTDDEQMAIKMYEGDIS